MHWFEAAPKAELHVHLEGTLEADLILAKSKANEIAIPYTSKEEIEAAKSFTNLESFLDLYYASTSVLRTEADFYDMTMAYYRKCKEQNVVHTELFFDPQAHTVRGVALADVFEGIKKATNDATKELGISIRLIMSFLRDMSEEDAFKVFHESAQWHDILLGVGLDSNEEGNPPEKFSRVFAAAREKGLIAFAHAGEEASSDSIWGALNELKVQRVDHGVRATDDPALVKYLAEKQVPLTVCPLSNVRLKVFQEMKEHNLLTILHAGICVTINSDDPAYFGGYVNENFIAIKNALDIGDDDMERLLVNSFKASMITEEQKEAWIGGVAESRLNH